MDFAANWVPRGWLPCDGRLMSIAQNSALFSILGTTYGGDGITTFGLPHLVPKNSNPQGTLLTIIAVQGVYPSRND